MHGAHQPWSSISSSSSSLSPSSLPSSSVTSSVTYICYFLLNIFIVTVFNDGTIVIFCTLRNLFTAKPFNMYIIISQFKPIIKLSIYLGKAKQCELITQITFYNINFDVLSQIYRTIHFHMMKLLIWILWSDVLKLFGKGYGYETLTVGSTLNDWQTVFSRFNFAQVRYGLGKV